MKLRLGNLDDGPNKQVFLPQVNTPSSDIHSTDAIVYHHIPIINYYHVRLSCHVDILLSMLSVHYE